MICDVSALEAVRELAASALLTVVLTENDTGKPQGGFISGEVHLAPPYDLIRVNGRQPLDKRLVHQLRLIGLDKQRHAGEDGPFERAGGSMPRSGNQTQHPGEGRAAQEPVSVDDGAGGSNFKWFPGGPVQRPGKASVLYPLFHINQPFGRYASAQIEMKVCRQAAAFLVKFVQGECTLQRTGR